MNSVSLLNSVRNRRVDDILRGVIGIFESVFPDRIRGYYLKGSYTDGTAVPASDIDVDILFVDSFRSREEHEKAQQTSEYCSLISPIELELNLYGEGQALRIGLPELKFASVLLHGEDIRDKLVLIPLEWWQRSLMHVPYRFFSRIREKPEFLVFPLNYPDPEGQFYGYDKRKSRDAVGSLRPGTKEIINCVGKSALAIIALKANIYVNDINDCLKQYRTRINDEWTDLIQDVYAKCRRTWEYCVPEDTDDRKQLKNICERTLVFENYFLSLYKEFLLAELKNERDNSLWLSVTEAVKQVGFCEQRLRKKIENGEIQSANEYGEQLALLEKVDKIWAAKAFGKVIYSDSEVVDTLMALENDENEELRYAATESLRKIQRVIGS